MYFYSERPGTLAARRYADDVPETEKKRRLDQIVKLQNQVSRESNRKDLDTISKVLIEGDSKKSSSDWMGRNTQNKVVVFPKQNHLLGKGDYALVRIESCTGATLMGRII
jgi:tRNA-2-methylthio-N6-dimethylallyladenosine synthase